MFGSSLHASTCSIRVWQFFSCGSVFFAGLKTVDVSGLYHKEERALHIITATLFQCPMSVEFRPAVLRSNFCIMR